MKVLDFGLAKSVEAAPETANLTHSPTLSVMATQAGMIMGTAAFGSETRVETAGSVPSTAPTRHVDVTPDGKRFLVVLPEGAGSAQRTSINVVLNWGEELKTKVP